MNPIVQPKFSFGEEVYHSVRMRCCENSSIEQYSTLVFTVVGIVLGSDGYEYTLSHAEATINGVSEDVLVNGG